MRSNKYAAGRDHTWRHESEGARHEPQQDHPSRDRRSQPLLQPGGGSRSSRPHHRRRRVRRPHGPQRQRQDHRGRAHLRPAGAHQGLGPHRRATPWTTREEAVAARRLLSYVPDNPYLYHDLTVATTCGWWPRPTAWQATIWSSASTGCCARWGWRTGPTSSPPNSRGVCGRRRPSPARSSGPSRCWCSTSPRSAWMPPPWRPCATCCSSRVGAKRAILLMTHDEAFARSVATRVLHIAEGHVTEASRCNLAGPRHG